MKYVMEAIKKREAEEKLPVIKLEIDYELITLYDAMKDNDQEAMDISKQRLNELRREMLALS
ncbi:hypothetical protein ERJ70_08210 [Sediminibacillus dalangtanensis]|uniref:Uncharacterized protein n=1 Tax=Sediminibacillus dalangtanensis TaxID=2729421 RepID=A0ABX7VQU4_9BACI|nr:hypothetical protein [Sediminibacillus dalangtanensis]QTM99289.1 hypothetical protein ERJ70_08210 [Sediminibacillus dalangtanensis]